jgi:hypothetical protein
MLRSRKPKSLKCERQALTNRPSKSRRRCVRRSAPPIRIPRAHTSPSSQVLAEDGVALNDSRQRLTAAVDALRLLVEGARAEGAPASESAELRAAEEALAAATA